MSLKEVNPVIEKLNGPLTFGAFMLGIRTTMDLSQVEMAKKLGISKAALCEIEKGRTFVSAESAARYSKKAGFSVALALECCFQDQLRRAKIKKRVRIEDEN